MKTNAIDYPSVASSRTPGTSRLAGFGRALLVTSCVSLVSFAAVPQALAAGADGEYKFTSIKGSLELVGGDANPPLSVVKKLAGVVNGNFTIQNNTLKFNRNATVDIVKNLTDDPKFTLTSKVTGPTSLVLTKSGSTYGGELARPIVIKFEANFNDQDLSGKLITDVAATVDGKKLKLVISFSGNMEGGPFSGQLILIGKR
ncbi:MAG: hypothetical protein ABIS50_04600 [Luteolibacter sp.]|uniref:hypothetical protein n=1 Tax=Luteolibacter sp. TaxID=1962973 RepID=UPI00326603A5